MESTDVDGTRILRVALQQGALRDITVGLCLLWNDLVPAMDLNAASSQQTLRFLVSKRPESFRAHASWSPSLICIELSRPEFEAVMYFFLRTIRDGMAEVDHIDVEAFDNNKMQKRTAIVLKFPQSMPPVSSDEARRRLGLS
jgi:hypothetical protein